MTNLMSSRSAKLSAILALALLLTLMFLIASPAESSASNSVSDYGITVPTGVQNTCSGTALPGAGASPNSCPDGSIEDA